MILGLWIGLIMGMGTVEDAAMTAGPMVGYSSKREVMIWVQTNRSAGVQIRYWDRETAKTQPASKVARTTESFITQKADDFIAHIAIGELEPGRRFDFDVLINGKAVPHEHPFTFQTQVLFEWRTDPPDFTVAFGSCLFVNETQYDRMGKPYGSDFQILERIADQKADVMVWLGDNTYLREVDYDSRSGILYRNRHTRAIPQLKRLLAGSHHYATWDDHDYGPNDSDRGYALKGEALNAFKLYWANPVYGTPETPGVFFNFKWQDVDFFMLDDRYYRSPDNEEDSPNKTQLGKAQLQWLKDNLIYSRAPFKIIVNGGQVLNRYTSYESYNVYKYERDELVAFIKKYKIAGVLFLTGDIHHTELLRDVDPSFYPLYEFTSSALTSGLHAGDTTFVNPQLVPGTKVTDVHTFGMLRISGKRNDRKMIMETWDADGRLVWKYDIHENELKPKPGR